MIFSSWKRDFDPRFSTANGVTLLDKIRRSAWYAFQASPGRNKHQQFIDKMSLCAQNPSTILNNRQDSDQ
ncbi:hypothetical protein D1F64_16635 [Breoghania sp. L-A4]|nr:hypothetical protein D1F64_16635 [Breoghania sp. L-A4]